MTQAPINSAELTGPDGPLEERGAAGLVGRLMSTLIRKLAWSKLSEPKVAITVSAAGLLLGMLVGATAPNAETLPIRLPLSDLLPSLSHHTSSSRRLMLYTADHPRLPGARRDAVGAQPGLAPNPRHLLLAARPSSRSWSASPRSARRTPRATPPTAGSRRRAGTRTRPTPLAWLGDHPPTPRPSARCGSRSRPSTGPFATVIQSFAAIDWRPERRHHHLGLDDPQRRRVHRRRIAAAEDLGRSGAGDAVLDREPGPHPAAGERRSPGHVRGGGGDLRDPGGAPRPRVSAGDVLIGVLIGLACGIKIYAVLIGLGLALAAAPAATNGCAPPGSRRCHWRRSPWSTASTGSAR